MSGKIQYLLTILLFLLIFNIGMAEEGDTQITIKVSNNIAYIGDQINLKIIVKTNHENIQEIKIQTDKREFEILEQQPTIKRQQTDYIVFEKNVILSFFKVGDFEVGPFTVELVSNNQIIESKKTTSVPVSVKSVLKKEDKDIRQLKNLIKIKGDPWYILKYVIIAVAILGLITFLIITIIKKRRAIPPPPKPQMSPVQELEYRLRELEEKELHQKGKIKFHFLEMTQIFKYFLYRTYGFNAEDFTTEETLYHLNNSESEALLQDNFKFVFNTSDLAKFAKFIPDTSVYKELDEKISEMVTRYKLRITETSEKKNEDNQPEGNFVSDPSLPGTKK